jgi:hypothetical protein
VSVRKSQGRDTDDLLGWEMDWYGGQGIVSLMCIGQFSLNWYPPNKLEYRSFARREGRRWKFDLFLN